MSRADISITTPAIALKGARSVKLDFDCGDPLLLREEGASGDYSKRGNKLCGMFFEESGRETARQGCGKERTVLMMGKIYVIGS